MQAGNNRSFSIDFIDPFFAVAVHLGFAESIATRSWFHAGRFPRGNEWFPMLVFLLGFVTLLLSWVGYHQSIINKPLKGFARFVLDVLLVATYAFILMQVDHLGVVLAMLAIVYGLFILWDAAKIQEYHQKYSTWKPWSKANRRERVTVIFFVLFGVLALIYSLGWLAMGPALIGALLLTIAYRLTKDEPFWRWYKIEWKEMLFG